MQSNLPMHLTPRCSAYARRTGQPCRNGAMANGRCRMHGGKSPGAPKSNDNAYRHGDYTAEAVALRKTAARRSARMRVEGSRMR
jgi:hypothetical protein